MMKNINKKILKNRILIYACASVFDHNKIKIFKIKWSASKADDKSFKEKIPLVTTGHNTDKMNFLFFFYRRIYILKIPFLIVRIDLFCTMRQTQFFKSVCVNEYFR